MKATSADTYASKIIHGAYFPHIDGLRALAVLPVLLYHVFTALCPGGFAGVDVFFVISGYLITGGIHRDLQRDRFSIRNFYHRRIRRILPAYFVVIASVFLVGCAVYYSCPLRDLGDASVLGSLFSANIYHYVTGNDYFSPQVKDSPLLHLWSLSVEEQFYLVIPLLCALVWRWRRRWLAPTLFTLAVLSLAGAVYAIQAGSANKAFYFLQFRAWELLAGSLLALLPPLAVTEGQRIHWRVRWAALAGLALVLLPYALLSATVPFPGATALPSVLGAVLLIRYGHAGWTHALLASRPLVGVGKISYSLYLWHWPVTVFWRYLTYEQLTLWDYSGMIALSLVLAYLSWRFVEMPVRVSPFWTMRPTFAFAGAGIAVLVVAGAAAVFSRGWPAVLHPAANRLVVAVNQSRPGFLEREVLPRVSRLTRRLIGQPLQSSLLTRYEAWDFAFGGDGTYRLGNRKTDDLLLVGDSHAGVLNYGLDAALSLHNLGGLSICQSDTPIYTKPAVTRIQNVLRAHPRLTKVLLVQSWLSDHYPFQTSPRLQDDLRSFASSLRQRGVQLFIATDVPLYANTPSDIDARLAMQPPRSMLDEWRGLQSCSRYEAQQGEVNALLQRICRETGATLLPLHQAFRDGDHYLAVSRAQPALTCYYRNTDHLSPEGSLRAARFAGARLFPAPGMVFARNQRPAAD